MTTRNESLVRNLLALADNPNAYTPAYREAVFRAAARRLAEWDSAMAATEWAFAKRKTKE